MPTFLQFYDDWRVIFLYLIAFINIILLLSVEDKVLQRRDDLARQKCQKWQETRKQGLGRFILWRTLPWLLGAWFVHTIIMIAIAYFYGEDFTLRHDLQDALTFPFRNIRLGLGYLSFLLFLFVSSLGFWFIRERYCKDCLENA